jgi:type IV pilus assembly protein PilB
LVPYGYQPAGRGRLTLYRGKGCPTCNFTGLKGRVALYELMPMTQELKELVLKNASTAELRQAAQAQGMKTLRQAGLQKVIEGITTIDEIVRVTVAD